MPNFGLDKTMRDHQVEQLAPRFKAMPFEHAQAELQIVTDFFDSLRFQHGAEFFQNEPCFNSILSERNIVAGVGCEGKGQAKQARLFRIGTCDRRMKTKGILVEQRGDQVVP